eukprot:4795416-Amphidinium_carterae.1
MLGGFVQFPTPFGFAGLLFGVDMHPATLSGLAEDDSVPAACGVSTQYRGDTALPVGFDLSKGVEEEGAQCRGVLPPSSGDKVNSQGYLNWREAP